VRRRFNRSALFWYGLGMAAIQLALGIVVESAGETLRDPVYTENAARFEQRHVEMPTRPQMLVLGSSRVLWGLDAGLVSRIDGRTLVFNFGELGAGPMLEQVFLQRLLADGIRPNLVVIDVVPLELSAGDVVPMEESRLDPGRLTWTELRQVADYYRFPITAYARWWKARALVSVSRQRELRTALHIDEPRTGTPPAAAVDEYGYQIATPAPENRAASIHAGLQQYGRRLADAHLADGQVRALRDLVALCRHERLPFALVLMPESSGFRQLYRPEFLSEVDQLLAELQHGQETELIDARDWVSDNGFLDAHHLDDDGAKVFSARFAHEALPRLRHFYDPAFRTEQVARSDDSGK
jgi:hypothetical protein